MFEPRTRPIRVTQRHLLIVDGHSSHINLRFIEYAWNHLILILLLPPHSTHRLQLLDVNCFQPLATKYQVYLDQYLYKSIGQVQLIKRNFYEIFRPTWLNSFTLYNIQGGFEKAGIWPFKLDIVLDTITYRPPTPPNTQIDCLEPPPTPLTSKSIRRAQKAYKQNPTLVNLNLILQSQERLAA